MRTKTAYANISLHLFLLLLMFYLMKLFLLLEEMLL
jgi:hypothetical protein